MRQSDSPFSRCGALRRDLELYAEGELRDRASAERIRRHLDECGACTDYLSFYDELTATLLAETVPSRLPGLDVERIIDAAGASESRKRLAGGGLGAAVAAAASSFSPASRAAPARLTAREPRRRRAALPILLRMAAAFLLAGLIARWLFTGRQNSIEVASDGFPGPELAPSGIPAASAEEEAPRRSDGDLRWILDDEQASTRIRYAPLLRLYGFRPGLAPLARDVAGDAEPAPSLPEWVVDARAGSSRRRADGDKVFLIAEDPAQDARGPVEIDPVTWFASRDAAFRQFRHSAGAAGPATVYRVYIIEGPAALHTGLLPDRAPYASPMPVLDTSRRASQWTLPASWQR